MRQTGHCLLDRLLEITFEEQGLGSSRPPAARGDDPPFLLEEHQIGGEGGDIGGMVAGKDRADEGFGLLAAGRADLGMGDGNRLALAVEHVASGCLHDRNPLSKCSELSERSLTSS
ncbi:MAG: hypothetical protein AW07_04495 [Candidatus Accumulibacter sp. SK-11]|nr:MAG: hypothetical protein AW07_04495 [Candidatus Accumulibacter sp. SK-11]